MIDSLRSRLSSVAARLPAAVVTLAAGVGAVAASYTVSSTPQQLVISPVEDLLRAVVPGEVIFFMIQNFGSVAQQFNYALAILTTVVAFGGLAAFARAVGRQSGTEALAIPVSFVSAWLVASALTASPVRSLGVGLGTGLVVGIITVAGRDAESVPLDPGRRKVVGGGAAAMGMGALGIGKKLIIDGGFGASPVDRKPIDAVSINENNGVDTSDQLTVDDYLSMASARTFDDSIEPMVSEDFYEVSYKAGSPEIDREQWTLSVTGAVENELELSYDDLLEYRAENRASTLRCVGDSLNGKKVDNAVWTGTPISEILDDATLQSDSCCVMFRAADDFYEEFPVSALKDGLLAFGMNGRTLPRGHGYPVRALIPGHWGEINVKWITEIEILEEEMDGYWEQKGWHGTGPVNTVAKLWDEGVTYNEDGSVTMVGHAYAGTRGIDRVEVSTDGGSNWSEAEVSEPMPDVDVWRQWRYEFEPGDTTDVVVRAVDGTGTVQKQAESDAYPRGATGWVERTISA